MAEKEVERIKTQLSSISKSDNEVLLMAELESIAESFDTVQKLNADLLKQLVDKDEVISRLTGDVFCLVHPV